MRQIVFATLLLLAVVNIIRVFAVEDLRNEIVVTVPDTHLTPLDSE